MRTFKRLQSRALAVFALTAALLLMSACTKPTPRDVVKGDEGGNFELGVVKGESFEDLGYINQWSGKSEMRHYSFEICITHSLTRDPAEYQKFIVELPKQRHVEVQADQKGCIRWPETLSYNSLAEPAYVELVRWIRGAGVMRGRVQKRIGINPWVVDWNLQGAEVVDLDLDPSLRRQASRMALLREDALRVADQGPLGVRRQQALFLDAISVGFTPGTRTGNGLLNANLRMDLEPKLRRHLLHHMHQMYQQMPQSLEQVVPLHNGEFRVEYEVYGLSSVQKQGQKEVKFSRQLLAKGSVDRAQMVAGQLLVEQPISFLRRCAICEVEVALRLVPKAIPDIMPFEAVYVLGDEGVLDRLNSRGRIRSWARDGSWAQNGRGFDWENWKAEPKSGLVVETEDLGLEDLPSGFYKARQIEFSNLDPRFVGVETCETATQRALRFRVETKVTHPSGKPYRDYKFRVQAIEKDGSLTEIRLANDRTLRDGSLIWEDVLVHQYYVTQEYQIRNYIITDVESGAEFRHSIALNPWDWGFTFGADFRARGWENIEEKNRSAREQAIRPQILNYGFRYETVGFRYEMDENMTLRVHKNLLLRLDPRVLRYDSLVAGRNHNEPLRDGLYILRVGFQKQYVNQYGEEDEYIDTYEVITQVRAGVIVEEVEISMTDLTLMRVRSHFLVEIEPVDEAKIRKSCDFTRGVRDDWDGNFETVRMDPQITGLYPRTFVGPVILLSNYFGAGMRPTDELHNYWVSTRIRDRYSNGSGGLDDSWAPGPAHDLYCADRIDPLIFGLQSGEEVPERLAEAYCHEPLAGPPLDSEGQPIPGFYEYFVDTPRLMADVTIHGHLMPRQEELRRLAAERTREYAKLSSKLQMSNTEYLQMHNLHEIEERISLPELRHANIAFDGSANVSDFVEALNAPDLGFYHPNLIEVGGGRLSFVDLNTVGRVTQEDMENLMYRGKISDHMGLRLCHFWFNQFIPNLLPGDRSPYRRAFFREKGHRALPTHCSQALQMAQRVAGRGNKMTYIRPDDPTGDSHNPFRLVRQMKVGEVSNYRHTNGVSMNLQISADMKLNFSKDFRYGRGHNVNLGLPRGISEWFFGSSYNWGFQFSWGETDSKMEGAGTSTGTYLVVQKARFVVRVESFENCINLSINPGFFKDHRVENYIDPSLHPDEVLFLLTRGILLCTGIREKGPLDLRENFYYVAQHFTEGDMLDLGDRINHPWLMALRGDYDYIRMVNLLSSVNLRDQKNIWANSRDYKMSWEEQDYELESEAEAVTRMRRGRSQRWSPGGAVTGAVPFPSSTPAGDRLQREAELARQDNIEAQFNLMSPGRGNLPPGFDPVETLINQSEMHRQNPGSVPVYTQRAENSIEYKYFSQPGRRVNLRDLRYLDRYDIAIFPFKHPEDVYKGLLPTFPGYVTITPESFICKPQLTSIELGGTLPSCNGY